MPHADSVLGVDPTERKYRAPALEKGLDVLELLARDGHPMTLSQISVALRRSASELFRMIQVLEFKGYITQAQTGDGYVLTNKLFALGMAQAPVKSLVEAALPVMRALSNRIGQSCHLAAPSNDQIVVLARVEAPGDLGFSVRIGYRRNMTESASGLVLFAFQPDPVRLVWQERLKSLGKKRVEDFRARADQVREQGYLCQESDLVHGVLDLSAPIEGERGAVASLTVPFVRRKPEVCPPDEALAHLRSAAAEISVEVGVGDRA
jgi:DNA-binding IclR family transcriptional regulator